MKTETITWTRPGASIEITVHAASSFTVMMKQNGKRDKTFSAGLIRRSSSNPLFRGVPAVVVAMIGDATVCLTQPKLDEVMACVARVESANRAEATLNQEFGRLEMAVLCVQESIRTHMDGESSNPAALYEQERVAQQELRAWKGAHPAFWQEEMDRRASEQQRRDDEVAQSLIARGLD